MKSLDVVVEQAPEAKTVDKPAAKRRKKITVLVRRRNSSGVLIQTKEHLYD